MDFLKLKDYIFSKFVADTIWGILYTGVVGVAGIFLQTYIGNALGSSSLGIFNKSMAITLILSTISCFSISDTLVRFFALNKEDKKKLSVHLKAGILIVVSLAIFITVSGVIFLNLFDLGINRTLTNFLSYQLLCLPFFVSNRIMLSCLNGLRKMKLYALIQISRWGLLTLLTIVFIKITSSIVLAGFAFLITEALLFCLCLMAHSELIRITFLWSEIKSGAADLFHYSKNLIAGGIINEAGSNADILIISMFTTNSQIAIYSVALYVINGFLLLPNIIQLNFNPIIASVLSGKTGSHFDEIIIKGRKLSFLVMGAIAIVLCILFPVYIHVFMHKPEFIKSINIFYILMPGAFLGSIFYFLGAVFSMTGHPRIQSTLVVVLFTIKLISLFIFTKYFNITGSAIAIAITQFSGLAIFGWVMWSKFKANILKI